MKKRILIVSEVPLVKTFIIPTVRQLKKESNVVFDCLIVTKVNQNDYIDLLEDFEKVFSNEYPKGWLARLPKVRFLQYIIGLRKIAKKLPFYDIAHIQFHHYYYASFIPILNKKSKKIFISFFGSDFNQVENYKHFCNKISVNKSQGIFTTCNIFFLEQIKRKYRIKKTISTDILMPLYPAFQNFSIILESITKKSALNLLGLNGPVITCGYSGSSIVRHEEIINALLEVKEKIESYTLVFPMTYGQNSVENREKVKSLLKKTTFTYKIFDKYLPVEKIQALCIATDIFIHIQQRDQMSTSMLEQLAAGSIMITGKWLPYEMLIKKGVFFIQIENINELSSAIIDVISNFEQYKGKVNKNQEIILNMMRWENIRGNWHKYYELVPAE